MKRTIVVLIAILIMAGILLGQKVSQGDEFKKWMQDINANVKNFTDAYNAFDKPKAALAIDALQKDFEQVEAHFQKAQKADAVKWAKDAKDRFKDAQDRMKREDIAYALNLLQLAQKNCKSCHDVYKAPATKNNGN